MSSEPISSTRHAAVAEAASLHRARRRKETGRTLIEGPSVVSEAIEAGLDIHDLFVLEGEEVPAAWAGGVRFVTRPVLERIAGTETPRGPIAIATVPAPRRASDRPLLVAWGVSDPGNVGTMIRTAAAFGYGFAAGPETADPWSPKVLRSGAAGHFHTAIDVVDDLGGLGGLKLVGTVPRGGEVPGPLVAGEALLVGSEAHGLPEHVLDACDRLVTIPMSGPTESLNAAVAAGIAAYLGTASGQH
jgi:TrmH family RNA methyltransferase